MTDQPIIQVQNLRTHFHTDDGTLKAVDGVSFEIKPKTIVGIIGESGSGKSVTAQSIMRLVPSPGEIVEGSILFHSAKEPAKDPANYPAHIQDLAQLNPRGNEIRKIRGREISMVFQEPMTSLSPVHTIGAQIMESILIHVTPAKREAKEIALDMLDKVKISNPLQRFEEYPHQLSGGMRQRAMIAIALSCNPSLLIADEPTTALDVTVQAQILDLMRQLQDEFGMAIMYITHDLGVIAEVADEVNVMYLGRVVERASTIELFKNPLHPYTQRLLKSIPKVGRKARVRLDAIRGNVPIPLDFPRQCGFCSRCDEAMAGTCDVDIPELVDMGNGHFVRCFLHSNEKEG
ncbi:MAG: ABC transporter ATP-binding protein [Chloroflexota bacterium]